jgi:hypothetical protein
MINKELLLLRIDDVVCGVIALKDAGGAVTFS